MTALTAQSPEYYGVTRVVGPDGGPVAVTHAAFKSSIAFTRPNNATAYTAGDVIGRADTATPANAGDAIIRFAEVGPVGGALSLETVELHLETNAIPAGMTTFRLHLYGLPPAPALDNAVFNLTSAEIAKYLGFISLNTPVDLGDTIYSITTDIKRHINLVPYSGSLYAELETVGAFTPAALTPVTLKVSSRQLSPATQLVEDLPIAGSFPALPTLNLKFSENRNLIDDVSGRQLITFTRASSATFIDSAGRLQTAAVDVPRFDHNPTTGESLGLLVEEQRTNLLLQSENLGTTWAANGLLAFGSGSTLNAIAAPDGATTADLITENTATAQHNISQAVTTTGQKTFSVFAKQGPGTRLLRLLDFNATDGAQSETYFNLSTGTVASGTGAIRAFPDGWYRCSITTTTTVTSTYYISISSGNGVFSYAGDGTSGIYVWGAQLEAGAFATSYIPTTTAAVTRSADVASITGANFSSWYRQDEGTVFADVVSAPNNTIAQLAADISDTPGNERIFVRRTGAGSLAVAVIDGGVTQADVGAGSVISGGARYATAASYRLNSINLATNGQIGTEDTTATIPTPDRMFIGQNFASTQQAGGTIRRITYWPQRLSNSTLQTITQ